MPDNEVRRSEFSEERRNQHINDRWVSPSAIRKCQHCDPIDEFAISCINIGKHHCYQCGKVICIHCISPIKLRGVRKLPGSPKIYGERDYVQVCHTCIQEYYAYKINPQNDLSVNNNDFRLLQNHSEVLLNHHSFKTRLNIQNNQNATHVEPCYLALNGNRIIEFSIGATSAENNMPVLYTPMQSQNMPSDRGIRSRHYSRITMGGNTPWLWLTGALSGCTVLIVEYVDNAYGFIHLQPLVPTFKTQNKLRRYDADKTHKYLLQQNLALKEEAYKIVSNTGNRVRRYILVQSELQYNRISSEVPIVGVYSNNNWHFYLNVKDDIANNINNENKYEVRNLHWRDWCLPFAMVASMS